MNDNNLFNLREYNDLYQKDVAKIVGVKQQTYSLWERGIKIIPLKHLNTLCNYYKVSMNYIMGLTNNKYSNINTIKILDKTKIGNNIKHIRKQHCLTIRDLSKLLNTTPSTISYYENGKTLIITAFAYQIAKKYNISMDWLCGREQ